MELLHVYTVRCLINKCLFFSYYGSLQIHAFVYSRKRDGKKQKFMSYIICFTIIVYIHIILLSNMMSRKYNEGKKLRNAE